MPSLSPSSSPGSGVSLTFIHPGEFVPHCLLDPRVHLIGILFPAGPSKRYQPTERPLSHEGEGD